MMLHRHLLSTILLSLLTLPAVGQAQGVSLTSGYTDFTQWNLYGSATAVNTTPGNGFTYSLLSLTSPGTGDSAGAGFAPLAITLDANQSFTFDFNFFIPSGTIARGDGLTFTLTDVPGVGGGGSDLGYSGLPNSLAFAIDTFNFDGEPVSPSLQILQNGDSSTPLAFTETGLGDDIRDPAWQWRATLEYTPSGLNDETGNLIGSIYRPDFGTFSVAALVDLSTLGTITAEGHQVFYGFTAGNGLADDGHFITSAAPVPLPSAVWLFGASFISMIGFGRRKSKP